MGGFVAGMEYPDRTRVRARKMQSEFDALQRLKTLLVADKDKALGTSILNEITLFVF